MPRIVIFANGELADGEKILAQLQASDTIVCANGGTRRALALGLKPDFIIGDLDSMDPEDRKHIVASGIQMQTHSHDKNETDLELAIQYALKQGPASILIVAALGRRLDHTIGNIALLSGAAMAGTDIRLDDGVEEVFFCRTEASLSGAPGDLVSLIPWGASVNGVRTEGLRWPLHSETLYADKTRGISNELVENSARVSISDGLLLVIHRRQA